MGGDLALAGRQLLEADEPGVQPVGVGQLGRQLRLDLVVLDDLAAGGVDEEHAARLQAALADHVLGPEVEHAGLGGQHDQAVGGHPEAPGAQAVAVEHGAGQGAVGERDRGRPVPRLHERGVELVERPPRRVHLGVVLPRLGDHHQHGVGQAAPADVQQLQRLVEAGGVAAVGVADGEKSGNVARDAGRGQHRLTGAHPVAVALDRVDLAVVGDVAVGVGQRPAGEGVGGEARVHQCDGALVPFVAQVGEERLDLVGREHALVDDGPGRQRGEVDVGLVLGPLAQAEREPVEFEPLLPVGGGDEQLGEVRHDGPGARPRQVTVDRQLTPAEHGEALFGRDLLDEARGHAPGLLVERQERDAGRVRPGGGQREGHARAVERVGDLRQDPGSVAGVRLATLGPPMIKIAQRRQRLHHDPVSTASRDVGNHGDTAGIVLIGGVVQALGLGEPEVGSRH